MIKVETYRTRSMVNEPDNAVRVTHVSTGIVVIWEEEKSLMKNKLKAMTQLKATLILLGVYHDDDRCPGV